MYACEPRVGSVHGFCACGTVYGFCACGTVYGFCTVLWFTMSFRFVASSLRKGAQDLQQVGRDAWQISPH